MTDLDERTIELTKIVDAPIDVVFAAFTDAEHIAKWWGPEGFGVAFASSDARPGGTFRIVMRGPDGTEHPVDGTYRELEAPSHLVTVSSAVGPDGEPLLEATTTVDLIDADGKTEIRLHASGRALVPQANPMLAGMETGWTQSLRCLDDFVTGAADRQIVVMHLIEAAPAEVFEVFTTPEHLAQWWGPDGFTTTTESFDLRPGGEWRFTMHGPDGTDYPSLITYDEIIPGELLSYRHAGLSDDDDVVFDTAIWFDGFMGNTVVTLKAVFASAAARDDNVRKADAEEGGRQTMARLAAYVATRSAIAGH
jgi:uncharacterized protein YndB with AHSA1/START domain